jgi:hypothetical protein
MCPDRDLAKPPAKMVNKSNSLAEHPKSYPQRTPIPAMMRVALDWGLSVWRVHERQFRRIANGLVALRVVPLTLCAGARLT